MKKKTKKIIICVIAVIIVLVIGFVIGRVTGTNMNKMNINKDSSQSTTKEVEVGTQTIEKTLTSSGEITSSGTEKLTLNTSYYFSQMCVESDDIVLEGGNILEYSNGTYLTAPYDCVVSTYSVPSAGSICTSSNYVEIKNMKTLNMTLSIDESDINSIKVGQEVQITVNAFEDKTYTGKISKIDAVGTYSSSGTTFTATVEFENDGNVKIGMSASCSIIIEKAENVIAVEIDAVQTSNNQKYVVVVNSDGTTKNVNVETGISNDTYVEIKSGLSGGEKIQMVSNTSDSKNSFGGGNMPGNGEMPNMENMPNFDGNGSGMPSGGGMQNPSSNSGK